MTRPCRWPDGGCGDPIIDVLTVKGAKQVLDATPVKRIVLANKVLDETGTSYVLLIAHGDDQCAVVVDTYVDHHATCSAFAAKVERERAAKAAGS
jgi:hypothetical protein